MQPFESANWEDLLVHAVKHLVIALDSFLVYLTFGWHDAAPLKREPEGVGACSQKCFALPLTVHEFQ